VWVQDPEVAPRPVSNTASVTVTISNRLGLHARPAMVFVEAASAYEAEIKVCREDHCVDGKSIMQMMMLAATSGTKLDITATGPDAEDAIRTLKELVDRRFDEE
jgi:phosphocarrier protein HPr